MVRVKICGITNLADARTAVDAGCDALGFLFYKKSPRNISMNSARKIIRELSPRVVKIGVFVNAREKTIRRIAKICHLDMLQFHGSESPEFCQRFKGYKVIKGFRIKAKIDLDKIRAYKTFAYLFDTFSAGKLGGTGRSFDWRLISHLGSIKCPIFLSGGLSRSNVKKAIDIVGPDWVDVSTSIEISPGRKAHKKIRDFVKAAKGTVL